LILTEMEVPTRVITPSEQVRLTHAILDCRVEGSRAITSRLQDVIRKCDLVTQVIVQRSLLSAESALLHNFWVRLAEAKGRG